MTPVLFSISYAGLWGQHALSVSDFLRKAARLGYPAVEIAGKRPHLSVLDFTPSDLSDVRSLANDLNLEIATIAAYNDFTAGVATPEVPLGEIQIAYIRELARAGRLLDARVIRVFSGYTARPEAPGEDWDRCVRALRECAQICAGEGLVIGVQNHHDVGVGAAAFLELLADVNHPSCLAIFDPWAPAFHGEDLRACARSAAPRMIQTTFADYVRLDRYRNQPGLVNYAPMPAAMRAVPLGEGILDFPEFVAGLKEGGFDGYVAYEICSPLRRGGSEANLDAAAALALNCIRGWFQG